MIAQLTGLAGQIEADRCVIDVHGVGYLVHASTRTLSALPSPPEVTRVLVETVVREDAFLLYGFVDAAERDWFRLLTTVQGVGAKLALAILSALSPADVAATIAAADKAGLTRVSGVGARLAERILSELRDKAGKLPVGAGIVLPVQVASAGVEGDVLLALAGLGFRRAEAQPVVARILARLKEAGTGREADLDVVIRESLRELAR
ncbi:Holliday junction branch migration protein RuvA [Gluconacetobacter takamatsuzukensis]|uniref:Holliday junction branch migration complex subunit RuvA n=1 Tax=Gluconacetobacter takamatsuzukensis TaxID=1286190 RepID=A0A7W4KBD0_9PROT|nr:Holliday junction branch migration protein RuvA [Gluconacetobacter takamatsuzukensis]MBB2203789.1 Holliday junction branch migration protein RuvA [Gluconacetobacter takamatsuzukensis]